MKLFLPCGRRPSPHRAGGRNLADRWGLCRRLRIEPLEDRRLLSLAPTTLASFWQYGCYPQAGVLMDSAGNLFGTTTKGGPWGDGTVFEVASGSGTITTLASFNGTNGASPQGGVIEDASGNLFGTAYGGGASGCGAVFEIAKGSGTITTLASFNGTNGATPCAGLIEDASGNLFGTTYSGGASGDGTVFEIAKGSGAISTLASFNGANGAGPLAAVIEDASGNLLGTTGYGGASSDGTVFELTAGSGTITTLASFNNTNGAHPCAGVAEDASGNLFGTTEDGGPGWGTVFEVAKGSGKISTLASFNGTNGGNPQAGLIEDASGNLFGTAENGGASGDGTVFELAKGSFTITTLASFNWTNGEEPLAGVIEDASGNLFGTTYEGGAALDGTVFELAKGSGTITTLASFNGMNPVSPHAGVIEDASGNLFGTTYGGGAWGWGTVFEVAKGSGTFTTLASFNGGNGEQPQGGVIEDASGNLFGTTEYGGVWNYGTVFEIAQGSGTITTLASFNGSNGAYPWAGAIEDASGNLFGTTERGGASGYGTVFEIANGSGAITTLAASFNASNGEYPYAGVIEDASGNLFGTTEAGGTAGGGTVFEVAKGSGTITRLATFYSANGAHPYAGVIEDASGNLFGTTVQGGVWNYGTVFEIAKGSSSITTLASFNSTNGQYPYAGVVEDASGNLFGTTVNGGPSGDGTVFEIVKGSGKIATLASFSGTNGQNPYGGVIEDASGNLFGTTYAGGAGGCGTVFELPYADDGPLVGASTATVTGGVAGTTAATLSGATFTDANTAPPAGNFSVASVAWGDGRTDASGLSITGTGGGFAVNGSHLYANAGSYNFTITVSDAAGWITTITGTALVNPAPATVTLENLTQTYAGVPEYVDVSTTPAGLATGVAYTQNGQPVASPTAAGSYQIVASVTDPNYAGSATGTLVISPAPLTVAATDQSKTYGQAASLGTTAFAITSGTLFNGDTLTGVALDSAGAPGTATVSGSPYTIVPSAATGSGLSNYTISYADGQLAINAAPLTVTANDQSKTYGQAAPLGTTAFAITSGTLFNDDTLTGVALDSAGAPAAATVSGSPYTIVPSAATGSGLDNYTISYANGQLTVTAAPLTVTANDQSKTYGDVFTAFTGTVAGLQNGDKITASYASEGAAAAAGVSDSPYTITAVLNDPGGKLGNYVVTSTNGTLTVTKANQTIDWMTPGPAVYGTALGSGQLDATVSVVGPAAAGALTYTPPAGTIESAGCQTLSVAAAGTVDYNPATASVTLVVLGPGVDVVGAEVWLVGGNTNDQVEVKSAGSSNTGSTGVQIRAVLNGVTTTNTYKQAFTAVRFFGYGGNDSVRLAGSLTINAAITGGDGNDNVSLGSGNNTVTLGNGNDTVLTGNGSDVIALGNGSDTARTGSGNKTITAGDGRDTIAARTGADVVTLGGGDDSVSLGGGNNTVTLGNGNDRVVTGSGSDVIVLGGGSDSVVTGSGNKTITAGDGKDTVAGGTGADVVTLGGGSDHVLLGNGNNTVTLGNGNDNVMTGSGNNVIVTGNGTDRITAGNGDNLIAAGLGQHTIQAANGSNILIDGSAELTNSSDSLRQVLTDWVLGGDTAANVANIRSRLRVTFNRSHANCLWAGGGLDWFWATYAKDSIDRKPTDPLN
jgi:uncharacterized repeat protein (TIGR03803 family)